MLKHKKLLIDQDCPMCRAYGSAFTKMKLIDNETVAPYQTIGTAYASEIDMTRAKNEIAFLCTDTRQTKYGIDAMIAILTSKSRTFRSILNFKPIYYPLKALYAFVSYNRKVIAPAAIDPNARQCTPDASASLNWLYILCAALFTGFVLNLYAFEITSAMGLSYSSAREYIICFGQIFWQAGFAAIVGPKKVLSYLGNMSTVSVIGALLLIPALLIYNVLNLSIAYLIIAFLIVVTIMLSEHIRRCRLLGLPISLSLSWIGYRLMVVFVLTALHFNL
jgi:hypothetical protein